MRIGMILDKGFPPDSRVENEARTLIAQGHDVILFCWNFDDKPPSENREGIHIRRYKLSQKAFDLLSPFAFTLPMYTQLLKYYVRKFLKKNAFDVIHVHDIVAADPVMDIVKNTKPVVLDLHENRPSIMQLYTHINTGLGKLLINSKVWEKKQNELLRHADKIIVVTEEAKRDILADNPISSKNIYVVPNTVLIETFLSLPIDNKITEKFADDFVILYLGSTGIRRGTETAIKAMRILKNSKIKAKLVLVGKSRDEARLKELTQMLDVEDMIDFEGWKDVSLFPSYIASSDVCISPLLRNQHHDTTFANKLFQYMSMNKPVIVSDCPTQKNLVEKEQCGLVHKADDAEDLATKIIMLYDNKTLRETYGTNAKRAVIKEYNWRKTGRNLITLYANLENG